MPPVLLGWLGLLIHVIFPSRPWMLGLNGALLVIAAERKRDRGNCAQILKFPPVHVTFSHISLHKASQWPHSSSSGQPGAIPNVWDLCVCVCVFQLLSCVQLFVTPMDCSLPGSSVHGILLERILEYSFHMISQIHNTNMQNYLTGNKEKNKSLNPLDQHSVLIKFILFPYRHHSPFIL